MAKPVDREIRALRALFWSSRDPDGRAFAPLADAYRRKGELGEAESLIEDGLGRLPEFSTGYLVASRVARDRGDAGAARGHLDRLIGLDPGNVVALLERAELAILEGSRDLALSDSRAVLDLEPGNHTAAELLASLEETDVSGGGAPGDWDEGPAIEADGDWEEVRGLHTRTMAELYVRQGLLSRAIGVYERLAEVAPHDREVVARLEELRAQRREGPTSESPPSPPLLQEGPEPRSEPAGRKETSPPGLEEPPTDVDVQGHDPQWEEERMHEESASSAPGPENSDEIAADSTPASPPAQGRTSVRPISKYFEELLAWVPGAVADEARAPEAGAPDSPDELGGEESGDDFRDFEAWLDELKT